MLNISALCGMFTKFTSYLLVYLFAIPFGTLVFPSRILLTPEAHAFQVPQVNKLSWILLIWKYFDIAFIL